MPFAGNTAVWTVLCLAAAMLGCFWGYRLQKLVIALVVFGGAYMLVQHFGAQFVPSQGAVTGLAIVVALIAAGLSFHLYLAGLFAVLVIAGISVVGIWIANNWVALPVGIVAGCTLGMLAVRMNRPIVIVITGLAGGFVSAKYIALLLAHYMSFAIPSQAMLFVLGLPLFHTLLYDMILNHFLVIRYDLLTAFIISVYLLECQQTTIKADYSRNFALIFLYPV